MKRGCPDRPKTVDLAADLGLKRWEVMGVLEALWHFTASHAKRGDVGKWTNSQIANSIGWDRTSPDELVDALVRHKFLDTCDEHRLVVHDWQEHCDQTVSRSSEVKKHGFCLAIRTKNKNDVSEKLVDCTNSAQQTVPPKPIPKPKPPPDACASPAGAGGGGGRACDVCWDGPGVEEVKQALEEAGIREPALSELWFTVGVSRHLVKETAEKVRAEGGRGGVLIKAIRAACAVEAKRFEDKRERDDKRQRKRDAEDAQRRDDDRHRRDVDAYIDALDDADLERAKQDVLADLDPRLRTMVEGKNPRKNRILREKIYAKSKETSQSQTA